MWTSGKTLEVIPSLFVCFFVCLFVLICKMEINLFHELVLSSE